MSPDDRPEDAFGSGEPFTVGVEEELFLVDPVTGRQTNASAAVQKRLGRVEGTVERELHACQVELITDVCHSAGEATATLDGLRRAVLATGAGLIGSGTHPAATEGEAEITDKERYEHIRDLLGDAVATPVGGLHIHIGMPDAETAIRARLGTVEIRALDAQTSLEDTAGLVALAHCLARHAAEADPEPDPPAEVLEEGGFRAARFGVRARLPDPDGRLRPVAELLDDALAVAGDHAGALGCVDELTILPSLLQRGGGAGRQRAACEITGMDGLLRELTRLTAKGLEAAT